MVVDIPTASDFESACINALNLAWQTGYDLLHKEQLADFPTWDDDGTVNDEYWRSAQPVLRNALGLIQQAHELGLKGKLAAVSPFLLISQDADRWPKASGPVAFSAFRTLDAIDLPRAMDVFLSPLSDEFRRLYEDVRNKRNTFAHGVSRGDRLTALGLLKMILLTLKEVLPGQSWTKLRLDHLGSDPTAIAYSSDDAYPTLLRETDTILGALDPAEAKEFFGVDMKARRYQCPGRCYPEIHTDEFAADHDYPRLAQLRPEKTPGAVQLYCFVCGETSPVERTACVETNCPADVIGTVEQDERVCLTCGATQDIMEEECDGKSVKTKSQTPSPGSQVQ